MKRNDQAKIDILSAIDDGIVERNSIKRYRLIKRLENAPKRRKIWAFSSVAACLLAVLIGVFVILEAFVKQVPIYTGMTISSAKREDRIVASVDAPLMLDASGKLPTLNALFAQEKGDQGNHYGNQIDQENPFGNGNGKRPVEDVVEESLEVVGADRAIYYAQPNEDIYITIHIDNPDSFEILSFTLNGKKYSSYMFEDGSDMENLILKVNVGDVEGIVEYTIDAIKYVDGTDIKDVRMEGDKTVRAGVATEKQPTAAVSNELIGLYSVAFDVLVEDPLALIERSVGELYAVLYDGEQLVATKELEVGKKTNVEFDKLEDGKLYQYAIVANYDALDGTGFGGYALTKKAFYTNTLVAFDALSVTKEGVSFAYVWNDAVKDKTVTSLTLYRNGEKVRELEATATSVSGLLSDNEYTLVAEFVNRRENDSISVTFTTAKKTTPTVAITNPTKTQTSIGFGINVTDIDNVGAITKIELLHGNDTPVVAENTDVRAFNGLLSNNDYTVRVSYTYDLNDGKGAQTIVKTLGIKTEAKATPVVSIVDPTKTQTSIGFVISVTDPDQVGAITKIELLHGNDTPVVAENTGVRAFNGLLSNNDYTVRVTYTYDLNDGKGAQTLTKTLNIKTEAKATPEVAIVDPTKTQTSIGFGIDVTDTDQVGAITKIELLHGNDTPVVAENTGVRAFNGLLSNNDYTVRVTYTYDLNDGTGAHMIVKTLVIKTEAKATPKVSIVDPTKTQTSVGFGINVTDTDQVGTITKIELLHGNDTPVVAENTGVRAFNSLLSNNDYTVRVTYTYDLNDGKGTQTIVKTLVIKTEAKATPVVAIVDPTKTQTSIGFGIDVTDTDQVGAITKIELLHGNDTPVVAENTGVRAFNSLLSNNDYTVRVTYTYDLNDGTGAHTIVKTLVIKTEAKVTPVVSIVDPTKTQTSIGFGINVTDTDQVGAITKIELLKDGQLVKEAESLDVRSFDGLTSATQYAIKVTVVYDLNDGRGTQNMSVVKMVRTFAREITIEEFQITSQTTCLNQGDTIELKIHVNNPDQVLVESFMINEVACLATVYRPDILGNTVYTVRCITDTAGKYKLSVTSIVYDMGDGEKATQPMEFQSEEYLYVIGRLNFTDFGFLEDKTVFFEDESVLGFLDIENL